MPLTHRYTLLCDDVRQEKSGKWLIIGLYTPDIAVPSVPFAMPVLSFFNCFDATEPGDFDVSFRLSHGSTVLAGGSGRITVQKAGVVSLPLRLGPVQFPAATDYIFALEVQGLDAPIEITFAVRLRVPQAPSAPPTSAVH